MPSHADRLDIGHVRALFAQTPATLTGIAVALAVMTALYWTHADPLQMRSWMAAVTALWLVRLAHWQRWHRRRRAVDDDTLRRWRGSWTALVLAQGALWGLAVWLFWGLGNAYQHLALVLVVYSFCLASVQLLATQPRVFVAFTSLVLVPTIVRVASDDTQPWHWQLALILAILFGITVLMGRTYGGALGHAIRLQARADELAAQLRVEKAEADEARRVAEAANLAKTQFFAAASHDLRQPLHAMGLFAEALRQRSRDTEVASLVNSINESVDALEGLFGELLDITRIDSGGVDVHPAPVRLRDLFARLRLHFEPVAFEKGLQLGFRGGQLVAVADPLHLERILRNLVSNAIRYTDDGGVLVSARPRGGRLLIQVWDSGIGISPQALPRIFDEFYQVQTQRPLAAHQRKGLGLGLAIVQRLATLMAAPVAVRSNVGRGTVFSLELPAGRPLREGEARSSAGAAALPGLTLQGRRIVVVEDEPAVRDGLVVLLESWGAEVDAYETLDALRAGIAHLALPPPQLLLVDYRLPQGTTGLQALELLRARWPQDKLPAIVITGSSFSGHEDDALRHDYHLLIKPVLPARLRAMISFKLGMR